MYTRVFCFAVLSVVLPSVSATSFGQRFDNCSSGEVCRDCPELVESFRDGKITLSVLKENLCGVRKFCCASETPKKPLPPTNPVCDDSDSYCHLPRLVDGLCGTHSDLDKIVEEEGGDTIPGRYPFMALIATKTNLIEGGQVITYNKYRCVGSIINRWYILTAATCFDPNVEYDLAQEYVIIGEYDYGGAPDCIDGGRFCLEDIQTIPVERITKHEDHEFTRRGVLFDIGLVKLKSKIQYNRYVRPVCLPLGLPEEYDFLKINNYVEDIEEIRGHVIGWSFKTENTSTINPNVTFATIQQMADVPILTKAQCSTEIRLPISYDDQICAGGQGKGSCYGDGGGPLVINAFNKTTKDLLPNFEPGYWIQVGIVSFGPPECYNKPQVYTRVHKYIGWIRDNLKP